MNTSAHAQCRIQQRSVPPLIVTWLIEFGAVKYTHGARKRFFDKKSRNLLAQEVGEEVVNRLGNLLNTFIVETDTKLITVGHRTRRIKR